MPIKITCPGCKRVLTVKDEMAGKQGKCPACQKAILVPGPTTAGVQKTAGQRPPKVEEVEEIVEVVEAEELDDEPLRKKGPAGKRSRDEEEFEYVEEDEPRPKKKGQRSSDDEDDEPRRKPARRRDDDEDDDEPRRRPAARRSRDDDEDDDRSRRRRSRDDDEDDDRPRRRRSREDEDDDRPRRRSRDDYDDDEDDDRSKKRRARERKQAWGGVSTGISLNVLASWFYAGTWTIFLMCFLLTLLGGFARSEALFGLAGILTYPAIGLVITNWVLAEVGFAMCIPTPGRHGEKGLAIASVVLGGVVNLFWMYCALQLFGLLRSFGGGSGPALAQMGGHFGYGMGGIASMGMLVYLGGFVETARLSVFGFYCSSVGKTLGDKDLASSGSAVGIAVPCAVFGLALVDYLFSLLLSKMGGTAAGVLGIIMILMNFAAMIGLLLWYAKIASQAKEAALYSGR